MNSSRKFQIGAFTILLFHAVGLIGMNVGVYAPLFESVAWANILLSLALLMWCDESGPPQRREDAKQFATGTGLLSFVVAAGIVGFIAEVVGVHTGLLFGTYHYTAAFGWSLLSVPLVIGVNWALLTYAAGSAVSQFSFSPALKVFIAAALMTACDILLEGFAVKHHFWVWGNIPTLTVSAQEASSSPPLQNFIAWFVVSLILQSIYQRLLPHSRNRLAVFYVMVLVAFLALDRIL